jgi:carbonic anhydrase
LVVTKDVAVPEWIRKQSKKKDEVEEDEDESDEEEEEKEIQEEEEDEVDENVLEAVADILDARTGRAKVRETNVTAGD